MLESVQLNFRLSAKMVADMDFVAAKLHIGRNDWLRFRLAELIEKEKAALSSRNSHPFLMDDLSRFKEGIEAAYVKGKISGEEFAQIMNYEPGKLLEELRINEEEANWRGTLALKKYLLNIAEQNTKKPNK